MGIEFYNTVMGKRFYDAQIPAFIKAMNRIADALEKNNELLERSNKLAEKAAGAVSNKSLKDKLFTILQKKGFDGLVAFSFEEAKENERKKNIVLLDDGIYLTFKADLGKDKPVFGEFASWNEDEFEEDPTVYGSVGKWLSVLYDDSADEINRRINDNRIDPLGTLRFTPYGEDKV